MDKFTEELDQITHLKWVEVLKGINGIPDIMSFSILIRVDELFLKKYNLNNNVEFILHYNDGVATMKYYYQCTEVKPQSFYILPLNSRNVPLIETLGECVIQDTHEPNIKHLQVKTPGMIRNENIDEILL